MVKKLIKYDLLSIFRKLLPIEAVLLGIALLSRITQLFENDTATYKIVFYSSVVLYCIALAASFVMVFILCISHFYKNLYTLEGYLSFTLPVTTHQHIRAKLISTFIATLFSVLAGILSLFIITFGDVAKEGLKAAGYVISKVYHYVKGNLIGYGIEAFVFLIVAAVTGYMLIFACITLGQKARKNRVLAAFGFYFAWYVIVQTLETVLVVVISAVIAAMSPETLQKIGEFAVKNIFALIHGGFAVVIAGEIILFIIYYLITNRVMKRKLNLE